MKIYAFYKTYKGTVLKTDVYFFAARNFISVFSYYENTFPAFAVYTYSLLVHSQMNVSAQSARGRSGGKALRWLWL